MPSSVRNLAVATGLAISCVVGSAALAPRALAQYPIKPGEPIVEQSIVTRPAPAAAPTTAAAPATAGNAPLAANVTGTTLPAAAPRVTVNVLSETAIRSESVAMTGATGVFEMTSAGAAAIASGILLITVARRRRRVVAASRPAH